MFQLLVVSGLNEDVTYDYVFGGPRSTVSHSTLKLTSPPVRLRPDGKFCKFRVLFLNARNTS